MQNIKSKINYVYTHFALALGEEALHGLILKTTDATFARVGSLSITPQPLSWREDIHKGTGLMTCRRGLNRQPRATGCTSCLCACVLLGAFSNYTLCKPL